MKGIFDTKKKCDERILGRGLPLSCGIDFTCIRCEERKRLASEVLRVLQKYEGERGAIIQPIKEELGLTDGEGK